MKASAYLLAGILGYGVASTAFAGLAIMLVLRREERDPQASARDAAARSGLPDRPDRLDGDRLRASRPAALIADRNARLSACTSTPTGTRSSSPSCSARSPSPRSGSPSPARSARASGSSAVVNAIYLPTAFLSGSFWSPHAYPHFLRGDRGRPPAHLLHPPDARRRPPRPDVWSNWSRRRRRRAPGASAASSSRSAHSAGSRASVRLRACRGTPSDDVDELLVFPVREAETPGLEIRVNFGMFAGREATAAEIQELGAALLPEIGTAEIASETRFEIGPHTEADVHQVRIVGPERGPARRRLPDRRARRPADGDRRALGARLHRGAARRDQREL